MLFKFVVAASLAMLCEGAAIELPLTKVARLSNNRYYPVHAVQSSEVTLADGAFTVQETYVTEITIGGQIFKIMLDTGSSDLLIVGGSCVMYEYNTCNPQAPNKGKCPISGLDTGSFKGTYTGVSGKNCYGTPGVFTFASFDIYEADVILAGLEAKNQYLGYITSQSVGMWGNGQYALDGILGLAYNGLSRIYSKTEGKGDTYMSTMAKQNNLPNALAMCFDPSGHGGKLVVGGGELENMQFTPITEKQWYTVNMTSMSIGGTPLPNCLGVKTIVDSGTTEFVVPGYLLNSIANEICPIMSLMGIDCTLDKDFNQVVPLNFTATPDMITMLPDITINLPGVQLVVPPQSYIMYRGGPKYGDYLTYIYGIATDGYLVSPKGLVSIILGDVALMGNWVYFDAQNNRVGFHPIDNCDQQY